MPWRRFVRVNPCPREEYFSQLTAADNLAGLLKVLTRALPGSRLDNATVLARRFDHLETLVDGDTNRLFNVNVFAGLARLNRHVRVPMVGSRYADEVDRWVRQDLAKILNGLCLLFGCADECRGSFAMGPIDVTDGFDLNSLLQRDAQVLSPHHADADEGAGRTFVGAS